MASADQLKRRRDAALRLWDDPSAAVACPVNDDDLLRAWWLPSADDGRQGSFFVECPSCGWSMNVRAANPPDGLSMHT